MRDKKLESLDNKDNVKDIKVEKEPSPSISDSKDGNSDNSNKESKKAQTAPEMTPEAKLHQLYSLLEPDTYELGISEKRIKRAQLICSEIHSYSEEEKEFLVYPTLYQLHLHGYPTVEIASILGLQPATVKKYLKTIKKAYVHQYLKERTAEDILGESLAHFDHISKESLRESADDRLKDSDRKAFMDLSAKAEMAKNELLDRAGYFETVKRRNHLDSISQDNTPEAESRNELLEDIEDIMAEFRVIEE